MGQLRDKLIHALGGYTADDVEHIEKHWKDKIDRLQSQPVKLSAMGAGGGGYDTRSRGGDGGHGHTPSWYSRANEPVFIPSTPAQGQTLIIKPDKLFDNPTAPAGQLPLHKGALRLTGPERRELAHEAARWCKQQNIEASPENIIFYLDDRRMISAPTPGTAEKEEKTKPTKCRKCINYGWGMPQCRECSSGNGWKHYQPEPK